MDTTSIIELSVLFVLILLSAFFSSSETALSAINKIKLRTMEEEGIRGAKVLSKVLDDYDRCLTTILIGNNIVNLSASALATSLTIRIWGNVYVSVATGVLTLLVLIFGEIVPKTAARRKADKMAIIVAPIIWGLMIVLFPVVFIIDHLSMFVLWILRIRNADMKTITENEIRTFVDVGHEDGVIESDERKFINNVFDFSDSVAEDIMIPRIDMTAISEDASYREVMKVFRESMYTRLPVYRGEKEKIIGFINIKDFIRLKDGSSFEVRKFLREAYYTYEYKKTNDLLLEMREMSKNLTFVNNEYGETVGMITLEDLIEEIVGQIRDEYDHDEEERIQPFENGYSIEASMKLEDVNDELSTDFDSEDYDTIGGLVLDQLDRIPEDGEKVTLDDGTTLTVMGIKHNRIVRVFVVLPVKEEEDEE